MTPKELYREFAAARLRAKDESTRDLVQVWRAVQIYVKTQNDRRMPSLQSLLEPESKIQSYAEQKAAIEMLSSMYGGKIVERARAS